MEIKFIWVDKFNVLNDLGVNFHHSGEHMFEYDGINLKLILNKKSPLNFGKNITGVTAIAGENGSGKSSICEIIILTTATLQGGLSYEYEYKGIVCYGNYIFIHQSKTINNEKALQEANYKVVKFTRTPFERFVEEEENFKALGFVYYSNILDWRSDVYGLNLVNISTQSALLENYKQASNYSDGLVNQRTPTGEHNQDRPTLFEVYKIVEENRMVKFYVSKPNVRSFVNPSYFTLRSTYYANNRWLDLNSLSKVTGDNTVFQEYFGYYTRIFDVVFDKATEFDHQTKIPINKLKLKKALKLLYRLNLLVALALSKKEVPPADVASDFIFKRKQLSLFDVAGVVPLITLHDKIVNKSLVVSGDFEPYSMGKVNYRHTKDWRFYLIERYFLVNNKTAIGLLQEFISLEQSVLESDTTIRRLTNYSLSGLSSGEHSLFTFFSRLDDVMERYRRGRLNKDKLLLLIDEAEVGFHPAWKRVYFNKLLEYLKSINDFSFQLVLTTHSPYLLSDLPSQNIILLKKGKDDKTRIIDSEEFKTFGANIHELLGTSFFLKDGFMGEFAQNRIEDLIDFLKRKDHQTFENSDELYSKESAAEIISMVGDRVIADRLSDFYQEKYGSNNSLNDEDYIRFLQFELERMQINREQ